MWFCQGYQVMLNAEMAQIYKKKLKEENKYYRLFMIIGKEQSKVVG